MLRRMAGLLALLIIGGILAGCGKTADHQPLAEKGVSQGPPRDGEMLFKQFCAPCHPDGGNVSDPERTLHGSALKKNHITTPDDIVRIMRTPISRMIRFDAATVPDRDARAIGEYVLKTFK